MFYYLWVCLFLPIRGLRLHTLVCGASPMSWSEYYCCCLRYPAFPSLPLTERAPQLQLGYFYFCRFLLLWGGSNSNWMSTSGLARDRQVRARATDGERKSGKTRNNLRIKESGFASMTPLFSLLASPVCLPASALCLLPRLPMTCPVFLTWSMARACAALPGLGSLSSHWRRAALLSVFWWADEESAGAHHRDEEAHFFHGSALDCLLFPAPAIKGHRLQSVHWNYVSLAF